MKLTLVSERPRVGHFDENVATAARHVREAHGDLVVLGELFLPGYMAKDRFADLAVSAAGDALGPIQDAARETGRHVVVGFARRDDERRGLLYNSAAFVPPKGKTQTYDKWFLANFGPFEERLYFTPGNRLALVRVGSWRVGIQICYDIFFPELSKAYAMMGADLVLNISASPSTSRHSFELLFPARALETGTFFAYCNVAGTQEDIVFWAGSQVWGPRGDRKAAAPPVDPSVIEAELALEELEAARPLRPTVRDTRKDMVDVLVKSLRSLQK